MTPPTPPTRAPIPAPAATPAPGGFWPRARRHASFMIGCVLTALVLLAATVSLFWQPFPPGEINIPNKLAPPSATHWLGTDSLGRDLASQLLVGAQNSIVVGVVAVGIGLLLGVALGCVAAASAARGRGLLDEIIMRGCDFSFAFPALLTAIMLTAIYGPGLLMSIVAIGLFNIPVFARITRTSATAVWARDYITAARAAGKGTAAITIDHVLPNIASPLVVQATISFATAILAEAALSYLGLGTQPPQPSWGRMLSVLGLNLLGDGLRDLWDPRLARQR